MSMELRNTKDLSEVWLSIIMYGPPKCGKTSLASTLGANPLFIDFDDGMLTLKELGVNYIQPRTWEEILELTTLIRGGKLREKVQYDHIIVDSLAFMYSVIMDGVLKIAKRPTPQIQDWGLANERTKMMIDYLLKARHEQHYHFTLTCHEKIDRDEERGKIIGGIGATPALMNVLPAMFDEMYYLTVSTAGTVVKRTVNTVQSGFFPAGTRSAGRLLAAEEPNLNKMYNKIMGVK